MKFIEFLSKNWSQIAVIIGALGYFIKVILDFNIRKREIKFEYVYAVKASAFQDFFTCYMEFKDLLFTQSFRLKSNTVTFSELETIMNTKKKELEKKLNVLIMYCSQKERNSIYDVFTSCTIILYDVQKANAEKLQQVLLDYNERMMVIMDKFMKSFTLK
jgi:hypothetical protein